jgi:hypothetical protein
MGRSRSLIEAAMLERVGTVGTGFVLVGPLAIAFGMGGIRGLDSTIEGTGWFHAAVMAWVHTAIVNSVLGLVVWAVVGSFRRTWLPKGGVARRWLLMGLGVLPAVAASVAVVIRL